MMGRVLDGAFVWIAKVGCIESRRKSAASIVITRQPVSSNYRRNYNQVSSRIVVADFFALKQRIRDRWNANVLFTFDIKSTIWFDRSSNTLFSFFPTFPDFWFSRILRLQKRSSNFHGIGFLKVVTMDEVAFGGYGRMDVMSGLTNVISKSMKSYSSERRSFHWSQTAIAGQTFDQVADRV